MVVVIDELSLRVSIVIDIGVGVALVEVVDEVVVEEQEPSSTRRRATDESSSTGLSVDLRVRQFSVELVVFQTMPTQGNAPPGRFWPSQTFVHSSGVGK